MILKNYHHLNKDEIYLLILLVISVLVRIPVIILFGDTSLEYEWRQLLTNLILHGKLAYLTFDDGFLLPNLWMPPLYPYYLYLFSFLNLEQSNFIFIILLSQVVLASLSIIFFYKINIIFFSKKLSFYSSLLFSIFPLYVYSCSQISSISLQTFLTILFFYFFFKVVERKNIFTIFYFSVTSGLLILLRQYSIMKG